MILKRVRFAAVVMCLRAPDGRRDESLEKTGGHGRDATPLKEIGRASRARGRMARPRNNRGACRASTYAQLLGAGVSRGGSMSSSKNGSASQVGHDTGLIVAYGYAAQFPGETEKLALA
jgi:hypothetical protein